MVIFFLNTYGGSESSGTPLIAYKNVSTSSGEVIGRLEESIRYKKPFYAFRGIPYAKPPIGSRRFKVSRLQCFVCFRRNKHCKEYIVGFLFVASIY